MTKLMPGSLTCRGIVVALALANWGIHYPGNLDDDSLSQYAQAQSGYYDDWHPPIMAILLSGVFAVGGGIGLVTGVQAVVGTLGLYHLAAAVAARCGAGRYTDGISLITIGVLYSPFSPLPFYLVTFWKDVWLAITMVWILVLLQSLSVAPMTRCQFSIRAFALCTLTVVFVLVRHNAVAVLPVLLVAIYISIRRFGSRRLAVSAVALTAAMPWAVETGLAAAFRVIPSHPEVQVFALDLIGAVVEEPEVAEFLPDTVGHLLPGFREHYVPGNVSPLYGWGGAPLIAEQGYATASNRAILQTEYMRLIAQAPGTLFRVKLKAYSRLLRVRYSGLPNGIDPNDLGLRKNASFDSLRRLQMDLFDAVNRLPGVERLLGTHLPGVAAGCGLVIYLFARWLRVRTAQRFLDLTAGMFVLGYAFSFAFATTIDNHRFLYPTQLVFQTGLIAFAFSWLVRMLCRKQDQARSYDPLGSQAMQISMPLHETG